VPSLALLQNALFDEGSREMFLNKYNWNIEKPVGQDSSIRRYFRISKGQQTAILMETVPDGSEHATPGHGLGDFIRISQWLNNVGLKAPAVYEHDLEHGYAILEDLGDMCFREAACSGEDIEQLYGLAADVLKHLSEQNCPLDLPSYYESHVHRRHRRVVDWFMPLATGRKNENGLVEDYRAMWEEVENSLPAMQEGFLHIDFHAQNLMWLPNEKSLQQCGILDFQGAMRGPLPYDLGNLLEDARADVPVELKAKVLNILSEDQQAWFRVLTTQFHCRVIGQFLKQAVMDENTSYLPYLPRVQNHLKEALQDPALHPVARWFKEQGIDFAQDAELTRLSSLQGLVSADAQ